MPVVPVLFAGLVLVAPPTSLGAGASAAAPSAAGGRHSTAITISSSVPAFHGRVKSGSKRCQSRRRVRLYRKRAGKNPKFLGKDVSSGSGHWQVPVDNIRSGAYYAKAKPKRGGGCAGARSDLALID